MADPVTAIPERQRHLKRQAALLNERQSFITHWTELNDYIIPRRLRYLQTEKNDGRKKNSKIINNKATKSARTLGAGKMAGETSPARQWWRYLLTDEDLKNDPECVAWVFDTERVVRDTFARSNLYSKLHELWFLQGIFATAALYVEEDDEDDVRGYIFPLGQYCLASSARGRIDTIYREFQLTVDQVVREYGIEKCCPQTVDAYKRQLLDQNVTILHVIEPNVNRLTGKIDNANMPFVSTTWEKDASQDWTTPLRRSGYEEFPVFVARWDVIGEDVYGTGSPGMDALGDIKALQLLERRKAEAVDKTVRPPMKAPVAAKNARLSLLPGDVSYLDESAQTAKFEPAVKIDPASITAAEQSIREHENRIVETFFANLFLMMLMDDRQQPITAREVNERHEEKMLMLGPVIERDEDDVLDPLHDRVVRILARRGKLKPVPAKLQGRRIKIEYTSIMAQAQKLVGTTFTERFASFVGSLSAVNKKVLYVPNWLRMVRNYAEKLGISPDELNTEEEVQRLLDQEQAAAQQAQASQDALAAVQGAKVASETDMSGDSALSRLIGAAGGGVTPRA